MSSPADAPPKPKRARVDTAAAAGAGTGADDAPAASSVMAPFAAYEQYVAKLPSDEHALSCVLNANHELRRIVAETKKVVLPHRAAEHQRRDALIAFMRKYDLDCLQFQAKDVPADAVVQSLRDAGVPVPADAAPKLLAEDVAADGTWCLRLFERIATGEPVTSELVRDVVPAACTPAALSAALDAIETECTARLAEWRAKASGAAGRGRGRGRGGGAPPVPLTATPPEPQTRWCGKGKSCPQRALPAIGRPLTVREALAEALYGSLRDRSRPRKPMLTVTPTPGRPKAMKRTVELSPEVVAPLALQAVGFKLTHAVCAAAQATLKTERRRKTALMLCCESRVKNLLQAAAAHTAPPSIAAALAGAGAPAPPPPKLRRLLPTPEGDVWVTVCEKPVSVSVRSKPMSMWEVSQIVDAAVTAAVTAAGVSDKEPFDRSKHMGLVTNPDLVAALVAQMVTLVDSKREAAAAAATAAAAAGKTAAPSTTSRALPKLQLSIRRTVAGGGSGGADGDDDEDEYNDDEDEDDEDDGDGGDGAATTG